MENRGCRMLGILVYLTALVFTLNCSPALAQHLEAVINPQTNEEQSQIYIVLTNKPPAETEMSLQSWYRSFLPTTITTTTSSSQQPPQLIHEYRNVVNGFAARLTAGQVKAMEDREGFVSAQPESIFSFHTTHTPNFLGLLDDQGLGFWNQSNYGRGVIIGVVDGGVLPDHPSFNDEGVPPPPAKWKGKCEFNSTLCNNKLIGARNVQKSSMGEPPIDDRGHGCHTASTAAGNFVKGANVFGNANGTAAGVAPYAHLAIYKACSEACSESDVLAAIDVAIDDGVDVISISLGPASTNVRPFYNDLIAIGLFAATQKGIFVSCSAGNNGPNKKTVSNEAPWILTVGASTTDRTIKATARLGNGAEYDGQSTFQPKDFNPTLLPLVYAGSNGNQSSALCEKGSLVNVDVKGKIVLCERGGKLSRIGKGEEVGSAGGVAMILMNQEAQGYSTLSDNHVLPATHVDYDSGLKIKAYINSTNDPKATILFRGTVIENDQSLAPAVASLSSRGPSKASPGILKPDIIGPGVSILAAWPFSVDNSTASISTKSTFNIISGTSMACPHLSGIAALLKSSHPDWSPAVIKSAIMTTADVVNLAGNPIVDETLSPADLFATGAGHVNPSKANDPGLVYDLQSDDYIPYLCGLKYTNRQVETIIKRKVNCSEVKSIAETQLNYPSFSLVLGPDERQSFTRTVTNVGEANSTYTLEVSVPRGIGMEVRPNELVFTSVNQKATYTVDFIAQSGAGSEEFGEGYLKWVSGKYSVRSPISVNFLMKFEPISAL